MDEKLRVLFDTNIYELLYDEYLPKVKELIATQNITLYGCKVIRDELRDIPKTAMREKRNFRNLLLSIYDNLIGEHNYPVVGFVEKLAESYLNVYYGGIPKRKIFPDFLIVAIASIHNLDIVVSNDENSMKSILALKAYERVNNQSKLRTPKFISLNKFLKP
ncbi:MAG: hypothetical protein Q7S21_00925 [archaeon]|nr:hypothetical protein [archaeon]